MKLILVILVTLIMLMGAFALMARADEKWEGEKAEIQKDLQLLGVRSFALDQEERAVFFEKESVKRLIQEKQQKLMQIQVEEQKAKVEKEKSTEKR